MNKITLAVLAALSLSACAESNKPASNTIGLPEVPVLNKILNKSSNYPDFASLVEANGTAVVNVSVLQKKTAAPNAEEAIELLKKLIPGLPDIPADKAPKIPGKGLGSGFFITADGYILTNAHVVDEAEKVIIKTKDKKEYVAKIVGVDARTDVALLKIEGKFPAVNIGNPENVRPGEWVAAIGSPFGFDNSVTAGIVSAKGRFLPDENYLSFIQSDVAINPGNSGGPLFNLAGEVIGINSQIYSRTGGYMGMSFSIPIDSALKIAEQLKSKGKIARSRLGIQIQPVTYEMADALGLKDSSGAIVGQITSGSPAEKAGLQLGDIIVECDGNKIDTPQSLTRFISDAKPNSTVKLKVIRAGNEVVISSKVVEAETFAEPKKDKKDKDKDEVKPNKLGLVLKNNSTTIESVAGPALLSGLQKGDVVLAIQNQKVSSAVEIDTWFDKHPKAENVLVLAAREGVNRFVVINIKD